MIEAINKLRIFQEKFRSISNDKPTLLSEEEWYLRYRLSKEELDEYVEACKNNDIVEIADAITDRLFLVLGDAVCHGLGDILPELFEEVVASNMSKLDDNGEPIVNGENGVFDRDKPLGKILKSKNYFTPKLKEIIIKHYGESSVNSRK